MPSEKGEAGFCRVVEFLRFPVSLNVTIAASRTKCAFMSVIFHVAGGTIGFDALEFSIDMAGRALSGLVGAQKRERGL